MSQTTAVWAAELKQADSVRHGDAADAGSAPLPATLCEADRYATGRDHPHRQGRREDRRAARRAGEAPSRRCGSPSAAAAAPASSTRSPSTGPRRTTTSSRSTASPSSSTRSACSSSSARRSTTSKGLQGAGFQVNNPNVVAACGCGSSFQVKDDAAETRRASSCRRSEAGGLRRRARPARLRPRRAARRPGPRPARRTRTSPRRCRRRRSARR